LGAEDEKTNMKFRIIKEVEASNISDAIKKHRNNNIVECYRVKEKEKDKVSTEAIGFYIDTHEDEYEDE